MSAGAGGNGDSEDNTVFFNDYALETIVHDDHSNIINAKSRQKALACGGPSSIPTSTVKRQGFDFIQFFGLEPVQ